MSWDCAGTTSTTAVNSYWLYDSNSTNSTTYCYNDSTGTDDYPRWDNRPWEPVQSPPLRPMNQRVQEWYDVVVRIPSSPLPQPQGYSVRRVKSTAEQRAETLFRRVLGDVKYKELVRKRHLVVLGSDTKKYLVKRGARRIVCEDGISYGNASFERVPDFDEALATILALETRASQIKEQSCRCTADPRDVALLMPRAA